MARLLRDLDNPWARLDGQMILGTEPFLDRIRRAYVLTRDGDKREQPAFGRRTRYVAPWHFAGVKGNPVPGTFRETDVTL